jgi:hypothetical protein
MRRLVLYAVAIMIGGFTAVLAWAWPEARLAFITLGGGVVGALWWGAWRLPETKRVDLQRAAAVTMVVGLAMAIVFPSTRVACDSRPPPDSSEDSAATVRSISTSRFALRSVWPEQSAPRSLSV